MADTEISTVHRIGKDGLRMERIDQARAAASEELLNPTTGRRTLGQ